MEERVMEIGIVGLGRMGAGMARRLARAGVHVFCHDQSDAAREAIAGEPQVDCAENLSALCARLQGERVIVLLLPAGAAVEDTIHGWLHCGPSGAGHYAKMIHNGIEYGMMQALAEGFALLAARPELDIDLARLAEAWRHGSVVRSGLLDLCATILKENEDLSGVAPVIDDSGSGRWTALESIELGIPTPVITTALMARFSSQGRSDRTRKLIAMMRARFGGHAVHKGP